MIITQNKKLSKKQKRGIELAKKLAKTSSAHYKHGAVLTSSGTIINMEVNSDDYCRFSSRFNKTSLYPASRHAEIAVCLNQPTSSTEGGVLFVVRVKKNGELGISKPCEVCQGAMEFLGIKKIFYSDVDGSITEMKL